MNFFGVTLFRAFFLCFDTFLFTIIDIYLSVGISNDSVAVFAEKVIVALC